MIKGKEVGKKITILKGMESEINKKVNKGEKNERDKSEIKRRRREGQ